MAWTHADGEPRGSKIATRRGRSSEGRFGLMFKRLEPFAPPDELLADLAASMLDPATPTDPRADLDNPSIPAGHTFLGQFIDHDMTLDTTPLNLQNQDPDAITNFRSARFDLDSVYGAGPAGSPELYDPADGEKLAVIGLGNPSVPDDLPRRPNGSARLGDGRNDENVIVAQLHVAFLKFHNALVDHARPSAHGGPERRASSRLNARPDGISSGC